MTTKSDLERIVIYTDGAARSNPGPAAAAWVICDETGTVLVEEAVSLGTATNNVAEYEAVLGGLKAGAELCRGEAVVRSDSQLLVNQLNGSYAVKAEHLMDLTRDVHRVAVVFRGGVRYEHRLRSSRMIARADQLCNACLDALE